MSRDHQVSWSLRHHGAQEGQEDMAPGRGNAGPTKERSRGLDGVEGLREGVEQEHSPACGEILGPYLEKGRLWGGGGPRQVAHAGESSEKPGLAPSADTKSLAEL